MVNGAQPPRTRAIVEGALMAGITAILALIGIYIPLLQVIMNFFWTIPIILVTVRHGLSIGLMSTLVAGLLIFSLSSPVTAAILMLQFGGLALFYGYAFNRKLRPGLTLFFGALTAIASFVLAFYLSFLIFGLDAAGVVAQLRESIEPSIQLYKDWGLFERGQMSEDAMRQILQGAVNVIILIIPAILVIYGASSALMNYFVAEKVLARLKTPVPKIPPFKSWRLPWWVIWGFIIGYGANMAGSQLGNPFLSAVGTNIVLIYEMLSFVLGIAVVQFMIDKHLEGALLYRLLFLLFIIIFFRVAGLFLIAVGLTDLIFNYRKLPG